MKLKMKNGKGKMKVAAVSAFLHFAFFILPSQSFADRLFTSGFETNNFTETEWSGTSATAPTFDTATVHSGTYALRMNPTNGARVVRRTLPTITSGTLFFRLYFRCATLPNAVSSMLETRRAGPGAQSMQVRFNNASGVIRLRNNVTGTTVDGASTISTGTWYRVEARHLLADTGGEMEVRLYSDGSASPLETLSISNEDTLSTDVADVDFGFVDAVTADCFFDDAAGNNSSGTFQNSWTGPGKIAMRVPASNDTVTWTRTGANCSGTTNSDCVDDEPGTPDDASGYNSTSTAQTDRLNSSAMPAEVPSDADIILVDVYARLGGSSTTGTNTARVELWDEAGTKNDGPTYAGCDTATWTFMSSSQHLVFDAGARTKANLDDPDFDLGYEPVSLNQTCRATALWANVEWKEAAAPPSGPATLPRVIRW